ncbi:hypothetical protein GGF31_006569 [Allomyces arbusculus]|nr:hypothetical protein GGF31_006569 [Allomyces arbusculus]
MPRPWVMAQVVQVIQRYPQVTWAVLAAEIDVLWHNHTKKERHAKLSVRQAVFKRHGGQSVVNGAQIARIDPATGALVLVQDDFRVKMFLDKPRLQFAAAYQSKIQRISFAPRQVNQDPPFFFPTHGLVFHVADPHTHESTVWLNVTKIESTDHRKYAVYGNLCESPAALRPSQRSQPHDPDSLYVINLTGDATQLVPLLAVKTVFGFAMLLPSDEGSRYFEIGPETVVQRLEDSQPSVPIKSGQEGRTYISSLGPDMKNLTLFGTVVAVSDNRPHEVGGQRVNRVAVKLQDDSGVYDITVWGDIVKRAAKLLPGQLVLWCNLSTSHMKDGIKFFLNAQPTAHATLTIVSTIPALLTSSCLRDSGRIVDMPGRTFTAVAVRITAMPKAPYTRLSHTTCLKPIHLRDEMWQCTTCKEYILPGDLRKVQSIYSLVWSISDGHANAQCRATPTASSDIIGLPASDFDRLSQQQQHDWLAQLVGRRLLCGIITVRAPRRREGMAGPSHYFRIEMVSPWE